MGIFSELLPIAGGVVGGVFGGAPGAMVGGLLGSAGQRAMGGGALTGSPATPGQKGVFPSTKEGRRLLGVLQEQILGAKPTNLNLNGVTIPVLPPFLRQKARTAQQLMGGSVGGTAADGGILGGAAPALGAAAQIYGALGGQDPDSGMIKSGSWKDLANLINQDNDGSWWDDSWAGEY